MTQEKSAPFVISVVWGKSHFYSPASNEPFVWDGSLAVSGGTVIRLEHVHCKWGCYAQAIEEPECLTGLCWKSSVMPGDPAGLEGIRFSIQGDPATLVTLALAPVNIQFSLGELLDREHLRYHAGGKYSGSPIDVFLGPDARPRVSRKVFLNELKKHHGSGWLTLPEDFEDSLCRHVFSTYGVLVAPGRTSRAVFPVVNYDKKRQGDCLVKLQLMAVLDPDNPCSEGDRWMEAAVSVGGIEQNIRHLFTSFRQVQKLEDIYLSVPWQNLAPNHNALRIDNKDSRHSLLIHRVYIGVEYPSHGEALKSLPPLPAQPVIWVGFDTNTLTPENGEIDQFLQRMHAEELGNYVLFRLEGRREASTADLERWAANLVKFNFRAACCGVPGEECNLVMPAKAGPRYLGIHSHEISNLIYGWGEPDPAEARSNRTLPECQAAYLKRMSNCKIVGQAVPLQYMDYAAGVDLVISELPCGHSSLLLAAARGAARAYDKKFWGVHIANHVTRAPADEDMERRNFILLNQSWLYGARLIYDEESALLSFHDAPYAFSDPIPFARRQQYQALYHYGSTIALGEPLVRTGFLQGNFDCLVGGIQSSAYIKPTKFWGMIGPETKAWEFDTPERGWELLGTFMPGVWLYPVKQNPRAIRQFFAGTPHGQVDLVPITADTRKLSAYKLLVLPGWNTMTEDVHQNLLTYVKAGGHLVLCAAQCTEHVTRDFLLEKRDFRFFRGGDLRELAGVRLGAPEGIINSISFPNDKINACPDLPGLKTELCGAEALAVDQSGRPVLVENKVGKGRVWMLTVGEYWGHPALDEFRRELGKRLVAEHSQMPYLSGQSTDVDFHCFRAGDVQCVVLLNTDWTSAGNSKAVTLHSTAAEIPLKVREGRLTQVLLQNDFAVAFETLPAIVDELRCEQNGATFRAGGAGVAEVRICTPRKLKSIRVDGREHGHRGGVLNLDFGLTWNTRKVQVGYA